MEERPATSYETPVATDRGPRRRFLGLSLIGVVVIAVLAMGGLWRRSSLPENCLRRGRAALLAGDREGVLRESQRLGASPGFEAHARLLKGLLSIRDGRPDKALPDLIEASKTDATAVEAMTAAAECYYVMGGFVETVHTALATLDKDPGAIDARRWLASAYYDLGATENAVSQLEIISAKAPDDDRSERFLGLIAKDYERYERAAGHYREALRRNPRASDRDSIRIELAESLVKSSHFEEALEVLRECGRSALSVTLAAECAWNLGQTDDAQEQFREALRIDSNFAPASLKLGTLQLALGHVDEAIGTLKEAVKLAPQISQTHFHLAQAYSRKGEQDKAAGEMRRMQRIQSLEREFAQLHENASENPNDADIRCRIGLLARKLGKPELAQVWFRAALALDPKNQQARAALARVGAASSSP